MQMQMQMQINDNDISSIKMLLGNNKVIGEVEEMSEFLQDNNKTLENKCTDQNYILESPYDMFKSFKHKKCEKSYDSHIYDQNKNTNKVVNMIRDSSNPCEPDDEINGNNMMKSFLCIINPIMTLSSNEMSGLQIKKFKRELSMNLDNEKLYFKKMGFSRKKGITIEQMKTELVKDVTDGILSRESLTYLCNIANIDLVIIDIDKEERIVITSHQSNSNTDIYALSLETFQLEKIENNDFIGMTLRLYKDKQQINSDDSILEFRNRVNVMKFIELKRLGKFLFGEDALKKMKKDDLVRTIMEKI